MCLGLCAARPFGPLSLVYSRAKVVAAVANGSPGSEGRAVAPGAAKGAGLRTAGCGRGPAALSPDCRWPVGTYQAGMPAALAGSTKMLLSNIHHGFVNATSHDCDCTTYPWMPALDEPTGELHQIPATSDCMMLRTVRSMTQELVNGKRLCSSISPDGAAAFRPNP